MISGRHTTSLDQKILNKEWIVTYKCLARSGRRTIPYCGESDGQLDLFSKGSGS